MAKKTTYETEVRLGATTSASWKRTLTKAESNLEGLNRLSNHIMAGMAAGVTAAATASIYALSNAAETYRDFEQEMATVHSISGATATEFLAMKEAAMDAGRNTVYTATEAASALEYMSLAGWDVNQSINGLMPILELAAATGKELQTTSDLVTDSMSALGIGVDGLGMYLDKLVQTNNRANTTAEQLMEALVKAGGASRTLGADLDDTITALGILADNGNKGEEAGTALNAIFVRLAGNSQALKELNTLGVDLWDDDGKFIGFKEGLEQINDAMSKLTDEQRTKSLKNVAGTHYYSQMAYLLNAVGQQTEDGKNVWGELEQQVADSSGALDNMYGITTDTLEFAQKRLTSAMEDMQIRLVDVFSDDAKDFLLWLSEELPAATESITAFAEAHQGEFAEMMENLGEGIETLWKDGVAVGKWIISNRGAITGTLTGIATGIALIKTATIGMKIAELFTNPLSELVLVSGIVITALGGIAGAVNDAHEKAVNANLEAHFGEIALSMQDIEQAAEHIVGSEKLTQVLNVLKEFEELDSFQQGMENAADKLNKFNWKISIGMELTEEENEDYRKAIDDYVKNAQEYALQKQYAVSLNLELAFEDGDVGIADQINKMLGWDQNDPVSKVEKFYADKYQELSELGTRLNEAVTSAFQDGLLEVPEANTIASIQKSMAEIEKQLAEGEFEAELHYLGEEYAGGALDAASFQKLQEKVAENEEEAMEALKGSYVKNRSGIVSAYESGESELTEEEYRNLLDDLDKGFADEKAKLHLRSTGFLLETIQGNYSDEIAAYEKNKKDVLEHYNDSYFLETWENNGSLAMEGIEENIRKGGPDNETKDAIAELLNGMDPSIAGIYELQDIWDNLSPENQKLARETMRGFETLQGMTNHNRMLGGDVGDKQGLKRDIANTIEESGTYDQIQGYIDENYESITGYAKTAAEKSIEESMESAKTETIQPVIEKAYSFSQECLQEIFSQGFETEAPLDIYLNPNYSGQRNFGSSGEQKQSSIEGFIGKIHSNAEGGIYDSPILTTFAEEGPEMALPLDGTERAKRLWMQAGQILGTLPEGTRDQILLNGVSGSDKEGEAGKVVKVTYSPSITIQGNAGREEVQSALSLGLEELREMLAEIQREDARVSFG